MTAAIGNDHRIESPDTPFGRNAPAVAAACAVASAVLFFVQGRIVEAAAAAQNSVDSGAQGGHPLPAAWVHALPYPVVDAAFGPPAAPHVMLVVLGAIQTLVLFALWRAQRGRVPALAERIVGVAAALAMAATALFAKAINSFDVYAYAGYARLGLGGAYAPLPHRFDGTFAPIADAWGDPMTPSFYGPLWVSLSGAVAGHAPTLGAAIFALRWIELIALAVIIASLVARRTGMPLIALVALNPALYGLYVMNGHNDLVGAALLIAALACAGRLPLVAALLVAGAGLVKLPLAALGLVVFAGRGSLVRRCAYLALAVALTLAASWLFGGRAYFDDLILRLHQGGAGEGGLHFLIAKVLRVALFTAAAVALWVGFVRGIVWRSASWTMIALSSIVYPWYLAWSAAYAAASRRALAECLILLPVVAALLDPAFPAAGLGQLTLVAMLLYAGFEAFRARARAVPVA